MGGRGGGARTELSAPGASRDEDRIEDLVRQMMPISGEHWVTLARLRDNLQGMSRERQDAAITRLLREGRVSILVEPDLREIRARDRHAAFRFGGENYHLIRLRKK